MVATTTPRKLILSALICAVLPLSAQVAIAQDDGSYIEMNAEEFKQLVGKMQKMRTQRAQQLQYVRQQQYQYAARQAYPQAQAPQMNVAVPNQAPGVDVARLQQLERQTALLSEEIRLLREQLYYGTPQYAVAPMPPTQARSAPPAEQLRIAPTPPITDANGAQRNDRIERQMEDERRRYERELRSERDRVRDLEREIASLRGRDLDRSRERDITINTPAYVPVPVPTAPRNRIDTVVRTVRVGRDADSLLLRQQDSLTRALAALQAEMNRKPLRDTLVMDRPMVVRDTVRKTEVVTLTLVEDRVDLAAVLFGNDSSVLGPQAESQVKKAWETYRRESDATLLLRGFASQIGSVEYNEALSTRRAMAIRSRLIALGVPADHIRVIGNGIDPGNNLAQARRVEIQLLRTPGL